MPGWFKRLNWQQVVALAICVAGAIGALRSIPHEVWTKLTPEFWISAATMVIGIWRSSSTGKIVHPTPEAKREEAERILSEPPPPPRPRAKKKSHDDEETS